MLNVFNHEGQISHEFDGDEVIFQGVKIYVNANAEVVYGRQDGELQWEFDQIHLIYATDEDGNDLVLTNDEEKELVASISQQYDRNNWIDEKVWNSHQEDTYWERRR